MESYILATVIFVSFLLGFFLMFLIMAHFYKERDDKLETQFYAIRPGYYESTRKRVEREYEQAEQIKSKQEEDENTQKEYPNEPIIEEEDTETEPDDCGTEKEEEKDNFLAGRIPSKKNSFIQCMNDMKSERTYEDKLKDDKENENQAYNILKRRMDLKKTKDEAKEIQEEKVLKESSDVSNDMTGTIVEDTKENQEKQLECATDEKKE